MTARRRAATIAAAGLLFGLPAAAWFAAPSAGADDTPGANLAGIDAASTGVGVQISPLTPGVVGAGDVSQGNLVEAAFPYASGSISTGPSSTCVGSPVYPGDTAAGFGNDIGTFAPQFPPSIAAQLNDPVLARADYPAQVSTGTSASYSPPGGTGVGTAGANAGPAGASCTATTSTQSIGGQTIVIGSSSAGSTTTLTASTVAAAAHSDVSTISLLGGQIVLSGITSDASATSDGTTGQESSNFGIGSVKVAGQPASIGPNGITLGSSSSGSQLLPSANEVLIALQQAGISIHTVTPTSSTDGNQATVTSGGLVIAFVDQSIPNPGGQVPLSSVGLDINVGFTQASADATVLPPFASGGGDASAATGGGTTASPAIASTAAVAGGSVGATAVGGSLSAAPQMAQTAGASGTQSPSTNPGPSYTPAATILGAPVKVAWVVIAVLLSIVAAGPLLGYANWQLLRGRKS